MQLHVMAADQRKKHRFPMHRELRYKVLDDDTIVESGMGHTLDLGSGGVAFRIDSILTPGVLVELSISWPVLLGDTCPVRLVVLGRVLRSSLRASACTMIKYEFRTQGRAFQAGAAHTDPGLRRWADYLRKETVKAASA
jgi:hypothetical protein